MLLRTEQCNMCPDGKVSFYLMKENYIGGACDKCGYCCNEEQDTVEHAISLINDTL